MCTSKETDSFFPIKLSFSHNCFISVFALYLIHFFVFNFFLFAHIKSFLFPTPDLEIWRPIQFAEGASLEGAVDVVPRVPARPDDGAVLQGVAVGLTVVPRQKAQGVLQRDVIVVDVGEGALEGRVPPAGPEQGVDHYFTLKRLTV